MKLATPMISTRGTRCERIFCGSIRSIDCRTIQNSANARPISCASRERRIWREKSKHGDNKVTQDDFPNHIFAVPCSLGDCIIMQSIFRPASRRETLGEESEGGRRDGGLKMLCIMFYSRGSGKKNYKCVTLPNKSSLSIFAVVGFVKIGRNTLLAPDLSACSSWIFSKVTISFNEIQVNCTHRFFY